MVFVFPNTRDLVAYSRLRYFFFLLKQSTMNCRVGVNAVVFQGRIQPKVEGGQFGEGAPERK